MYVRRPRDSTFACVRILISTARYDYIKKCRSSQMSRFAARTARLKVKSNFCRQFFHRVMKN